MGGRLQVIQNLGLGRIFAGPFVVGCEGEAVEVREVVAGTAWVRVEEPGSSEIGFGLEDLVSCQLEHALKLDCGAYPGQSVGGERNE